MIKRLLNGMRELNKYRKGDLVPDLSIDTPEQRLSRIENSNRTLLKSGGWSEKDIEQFISEHRPSLLNRIQNGSGDPKIYYVYKKNTFEELIESQIQFWKKLDKSESEIEELIQEYKSRWEEDYFYSET